MSVTQEDVRRLHVPVYDPPGVRVGEAIADLLRQAHGFGDGQARFVLQPVAERFAFYEWHHVIQRVPGFARIKERQDIRVLKPRNQTDFIEETSAAVGAAEIGIDRLDGDGAIMLQVVRQKHRGHPRSADLPLEPIPVTERCLQRVEGIWHTAPAGRVKDG